MAECPSGTGGRRNSHHFERLTRAWVVSPWEMDIVWESAPGIQAGGNLPARACELEVVTGVTFHDECKMWPGRAGLRPGVSRRGEWELARLLCSVPWAGSSAAVPELSGGFSVGHGAQTGGQKESCPRHTEEGTGRRVGPGGGSGRPSLVAFRPSTACLLGPVLSSFPIPAGDRVHWPVLRPVPIPRAREPRAPGLTGPPGLRAVGAVGGGEEENAPKEKCVVPPSQKEA